MFDTFPTDPLGQVYLANIDLAITKSLIDEIELIDFLKKLEHYCNHSSSIKTESIIDGFAIQDYAFKRFKKPIIFEDVTTVISVCKLDTKDPKFLWLIDKNILNQNFLRRDPDIDMLVDWMKDADYIIPDAQIGRPNYPVWLAPKEEINNLKNKIGSSSGRALAEEVRDALGLAHLIEEKAHLIQITIKKNAFETYQSDGIIKFAAPSFIEAKSHKYFRTWTSCPQNWGRTRHLKDIKHEGVKEAVSSPIPYKTSYGIKYLGQTTNDPKGLKVTVDEHVESLLEGKDVGEVVNELRAKL